jgi:hypothetical protein
VLASPRFAGKQFILCGHSLGGAIAAIVTTELLLERHKQGNWSRLFKAELREIHICFISQIEVSFTGNTRIWTGVHQEILFCYFLLVYKTLHRTF